MDPQTPSNPDSQPETPFSVNPATPLQPGANQPPLPDDQATSLQADTFSTAAEPETLDLSQLQTPAALPPQPIPSSVESEPLVKPAEPVQPLSMPEFMRPSNQSRTTTTNHYTSTTSPESPQPGSVGMSPQPPGSIPPAPPVIIKHSHKLPVILAIIILFLLGGGAAAAYFFTHKNADTPASTASTPNDTRDTANTSSDNSEPASNNITAAKSMSDFDEVCKGGAISNATEYSSNKTAVIQGFHNKPNTADYWTSDSIGYNKSYYLEDTKDFAKISVVACAKYVDSSAQAGKDCEYKDNDNKSVTVNYNSTKYVLTFYEAKTGKKIKDGGDINGPATSCPSFVTYDPDTKVAYADPDDNALEAAYDAFVQ